MQTTIKRNGIGALAATLALACLATPASANGLGGTLGGPGFGGGVYGFNFGGLYSNLENRVPYFAAFPPVYYSHPVPRTYGYSPFAYPPYVATPELDLKAAGSKVINNPHVETSGPQSLPAPSDQTVDASSARGPLVIHNPYASSPRVLPASHAL